MERAWWKEAILYQIHPRSFQDSNGDGIGDLQGIIAQLAYLKDLGVDAIGLNPVGAADHQSIHPDYGTMADWAALRASLQAHGMRLVLDLGVNHTSDQHPWFTAARSSRWSPKRDWYLWHKGRFGQAPTHLAPSAAWERDWRTRQYYRHQFGLPELNWHNPEVRQAIYAGMQSWAERGADGFYLGALSVLDKPRDNGPRGPGPHPGPRPGPCRGPHCGHQTAAQKLRVALLREAQLRQESDLPVLVPSARVGLTPVGHGVESARLRATLNLTLPGTPLITQGDELGLTHLAGNPAQPPFPWDARARDQRLPDSTFRYYQRLIALRRETPALIHGEYVPYQADAPHLYLYERRLADERVLTVLNPSAHDQRLTLPADLAALRRKVLLDNRVGRADSADGTLHLGPWEARVYRVFA